MDYDTYENVLWVVSDNGYNNRAAKISVNGTADVDTVHVNAPSGVDVTANNEGFAIAEYTYTKDGQRPVYRFLDGVTSGSLSVGNLACNYVNDDKDDTQEDGKDETSDSTVDDGKDTTPDGAVEDEKEDVSDDTIDDNKNSDEEVTESPKTGDTLNVFHYMICACVSLGAMLGIILRKKIFR